jgi:phage-related holin
MKNALCLGIGAVGAWIADLFGGFDAALITLTLFMAADYITGLVVAGVFLRSPKA